MGFLTSHPKVPQPLPPPNPPSLASNQLAQALSAERTAAAAASGAGFGNTILTSGQGSNTGSSAKGATKTLLGDNAT